MEKLALYGGQPVINHQFSAYNSIRDEEIDAVNRVMKSGCLSGFYGSWGKEFYGGPMINDFEEFWARKFKVRHAVSLNSATSALFSAMGAIGINPGDEVIVPPYTMSATAMSPLIYGGIPVFVDIDEDTFCLNPAEVEAAINSRTKAIIAVNLFGHPAPLKELRAIAERHKLFLIEDNAQGPLASEGGQYAGTIGHVGIFSFNYHKHIHTGEGGIAVTNDEELAFRLRAIRNHGENIVQPLQLANMVNLIGFNYRMTELSAAIGIEQLKKIDLHVNARTDLAQRLSEGIRDLEGITVPKVRKGCRHVYYLWAVRFNEDIVGISREQFSKALSAEGFPHFIGYVKPLYLLPVFQNRIAFGNLNYPFNLTSVEYKEGQCPVTEQMWRKELLCFENCAYDIDEHGVSLLVEAFHKVYKNRFKILSI